MILKMIRNFALLNLRNKLQSSLLVSFVSELFTSILSVYTLSKVNLEMLEDLFYSGTLPQFPEEQLRVFWILLGLLLLFTPLFKMGAARFYLNLSRRSQPRFADVFDYVKQPLYAWAAYLVLALLCFLWTFVPLLLILLLHRLLPGLFTLQATSFLLTMGYIPLFYARLRYFAYIYIVVDGQERNYFKAARRSAKLFRNNGYGVLSMLLYFTFVLLLIQLCGSWFGFLGIVGDVLVRFVLLLIGAWAASSFAALYCYLNKESMFVEMESKGNAELQRFYEQMLQQLRDRGKTQEDGTQEDVPEELTEPEDTPSAPEQGTEDENHDPPKEER